MKNSLENNLRVWNEEYPWTEHGDEWQGQAKVCGVPYEVWKQSLLESLLWPALDPQSTVLEIACGHGRWSREMVGRCAELILVDMSPNCVEHCRELFGEEDSGTSVRYVLNEGRALPGVADGSVDFVWSYDSFVHMPAAVIASYLREIHRVLVPGGRAILHHAGRRHAFLWTRFLRHRGAAGAWIYRALTLGLGDDDGWRSDVSRKLVRQLVKKSGLTLESQVDTWDAERGIGVPRYGDAVTIVTK